MSDKNAPKPTTPDAGDVSAGEEQQPGKPLSPQGKQEKPLGQIVTVLYGWGKLGPKETRHLNASKNRMYKGVGGIYRQIPIAVAQEWKDSAIGDFIYLLPKDATVVDFVEATGLNPEMLKPETTAIVLANIQVKDFVEVVGTERALRFAQDVLIFLGNTVPTSADGRAARELLSVAH